MQSASVENTGNAAHDVAGVDTLIGREVLGEAEVLFDLNASLASLPRILCMQDLLPPTPGRPGLTEGSPLRLDPDTLLARTVPEAKNIPMSQQGIARYFRP